MNARAIYRKTAKGAEAVATRGYGVAAGRLRTLLILVDGRRSGQDLTQLALGMGESDELLVQLEAQGLIEEADGA